jgi:hypothetical protein
VLRGCLQRRTRTTCRSHQCLLLLSYPCESGHHRPSTPTTPRTSTASSHTSASSLLSTGSNRLTTVCACQSIATHTHTHTHTHTGAFPLTWGPLREYSMNGLPRAMSTRPLCALPIQPLGNAGELCRGSLVSHKLVPSERWCLIVVGQIARRRHR